MSQTVKTHTVIVRGVSKSVKNELKRRGLATHGGSQNTECLKAFDFYLEKMKEKEKPVKNEK